jgi:hypothetical protein
MTGRFGSKEVLIQYLFVVRVEGVFAPREYLRAVEDCEDQDGNGIEKGKEMGLGI